MSNFASNAQDDLSAEVEYFSSALNKIVELFGNLHVSQTTDVAFVLANYTNFADAITLCVVVLGVASMLFKNQPTSRKKKRADDTNKMAAGYNQVLEQFAGAVNGINDKLLTTDFEQVAEAPTSNELLQKLSSLTIFGSDVSDCVLMIAV